MGRFVLEFNIAYVDIGQRIKDFRIKQNITQEKLAELSSVSVPHMSNIELGKTKLSLPAIINIANALNVSVDEILCGNLNQGKFLLNNEYASLLSDCSTEEIKAINSIAKLFKDSLRKIEGK